MSKSFRIVTEWAPRFSKLYALEYLSVIKRNIDQYGNRGRICAVTSENKRCSVKARKLCTKQYPGFFSFKDKSLIADLPIENISDIELMESVIDSYSNTFSSIHSQRKLKSKLAEFMEVFNVLVNIDWKERDGAAAGLSSTGENEGNLERLN